MAEEIGASGGSGARAPRAVVVAVGDELLLGETVNTNQAWLGRELTRLGLNVVGGRSVGDAPGDIRRALVAALEQADVVLVTGGLGPTPDDRTKEVVADLLDRPLELRQDLYDRLEQIFRSLGYDELPPSNRSQAEVPRGSLCLTNPKGSAPGIVLSATDIGGSGSAEGPSELSPPAPPLLVLLPGIPREVEAIFRSGLEDLLVEVLGAGLRPTRHRTIHTVGVAESVLSEMIEDALPADMGPVTLASLPAPAGVDLRLSAREVAEAGEADAWLDRVEKSLESVLEPYRFESDRGDLVDALARALVESGRTLAVAESCTGGLLGQRLTRWPGASRFFLGGVIAYSDASKVRDLGVSEDTLRGTGAVSEPVVRAMAHGVADRFGSDTALAITGIAGPEGGTVEKPRGTVWYAALVEGEVHSRRRRFPGDRELVRERSAQAALHLLLRLL